MDRKDLRQRIIQSLNPQLRNQEPQRIKITFQKRKEFVGELPERSASVKICKGKSAKLQIYSSPNTTYKTQSLNKFKDNIQIWKQIQNPKILNLGKKRQYNYFLKDMANKIQVYKPNTKIAINPQIQMSEVKLYQDSSIYKRQQKQKQKQKQKVQLSLNDYQLKKYTGENQLQDCLRLVQEMNSQIINLRTSMQESLMRTRCASHQDFTKVKQDFKFQTPVKANNNKPSLQQLQDKYGSTYQTRKSYNKNEQPNQNQNQNNISERVSHGSGSGLNQIQTSSRIIYETPKKFFA